MASDDSIRFDVLGLLDAFEGVEFIVVGGIAVALHGGPRLTLDLDIVPATSDSNVRHLNDCFRELDAVVREPGNRRLPVTNELLQAARETTRAGQLRIRTKRGPVDILWRLHDGRGYDELLGGSVALSDDEREVRVIGIDDLIQVKKSAGRPQDIEDVRYLEQIRQRSQRKDP
jgi:hypothetical protein